jgi:hypothetical protein
VRGNRCKSDNGWNLNGALWNPLETDKHGLARLVKLVAASLQRPAQQKESTVSPRIGEVKSAVIHVLELADGPLSLGEVRQRCEELLGRAVNASTVKDCVHKNARGINPLFSRVEHGRYVERRLLE